MVPREKMYERILTYRHYLEKRGIGSNFLRLNPTNYFLLENIIKNNTNSTWYINSHRHPLDDCKFMGYNVSIIYTSADRHRWVQLRDFMLFVHLHHRTPWWGIKTGSGLPVFDSKHRLSRYHKKETSHVLS